MELIEYRNVAIRYGNAPPVVKDVSFSLPAGGITAFLGPNGSGKTTLMSALDRLITPCAGDILLGSRSIRTIPLRELAKQVAFVPQFTPPGFGYSVYDMILCGRAAHIAYLPGPEDRAAVEEVIERFGIERLRDKPVGELSGGEKQMVLIARAIAQKTPVVLMDEPTTYLDIRNQVKILNVIREINRSDGVTFAIALHDPNHALSLADRVVLVSGGSAVLEKTETAMTVENMDRLYGVKTAFTEAFGTRCLNIDFRG